MHPLEQVRGGDIGQIEWGVLAQQDHVELRQLGAARLAEREMVAGFVTYRQGLNGREDAALDLRQPVRRVVGQAVPACLRLEQHRKRRVAADVDPLDRVHLHGDIQRHCAPVQNLWLG
jgi:hypothetical protein